MRPIETKESLKNEIRELAYSMEDSLRRSPPPPGAQIFFESFGLAEWDYFGVVEYLLNKKDATKERLVQLRNDLKQFKGGN